jgi:hypothetical protein
MEDVVELRRAIRDGDTFEVGRILRDNPGISKQDRMLPPALFLALDTVNPKRVIEALIKDGTDVNVEYTGQTILDELKFRREEKIGLTGIIKLVERLGGRSPVYDRAQREKEDRRLELEEIQKGRAKVKVEPERFSWNGFTVVNGGLSDVEMKGVLSKLEGLVRRFKQKGFGHLIYGSLLITSDNMKGSVFNVSDGAWHDINSAGKYYRGKDYVLINADHLKGSRGLEIVAHELGHRQWFKFMDSTARKTWEGGYDARGVKVTASMARHIISVIKAAAPMDTDALGNRYRNWERFDYNKFMRKIKTYEKRYGSLTVLTEMANNRSYLSGKGARRRKAFVMGMLREFNIGGSLVSMSYHIGVVARFLAGKMDEDMDTLPVLFRRHIDDRNWVEGKYNELRDLVDEAKPLNTIMADVGRVLVPPTSTTEYGSNNTKEDYAEAFGHFMVNKPMPEGIYNQFMRSSGLRKASKDFRLAGNNGCRYGFNEMMNEQIASELVSVAKMLVAKRERIGGRTNSTRLLAKGGQVEMREASDNLGDWCMEED